MTSMDRLNTVIQLPINTVSMLTQQPERTNSANPNTWCFFKITAPLINLRKPLAHELMATWKLL
jgi:hypothetical protein